MIVYKTTNLINGKCYIGQDAKNNPAYLGSGVALNRAIKKYGKENFKKEIVAWCCTKEHLDFLEVFYIKLFNTKSLNGYNLTDGGDGFKGKHSEETRRKMSEARKGYIGRNGVFRHSKETRKKISEIQMGRMGIKCSEETKKKISKANKGRAPWTNGRHLSRATRRKISKANMGHGRTVHSEETKKKISEALMGHVGWNKGHVGFKHSEETKRKISKALMGRKYHTEFLKIPCN
jgi:group I intron endonuclease